MQAAVMNPWRRSLLSAVAFTNLADLFRHGVDLETADLVGTVALRLFLAMSLMSLDLLAVAKAAGLILSALALQCIVTTLIAVTLVRHAAAMGAQGAQAVREGAVAAGGFMGFGLGAMPVGLSVMQRITLQHGAAPRAFLVVTLGPCRRGAGRAELGGALRPTRRHTPRPQRVPGSLATGRAWRRASPTADQPVPKPRSRSRSSTRTPPYSTAIRPPSCLWLRRHSSIPLENTFSEAPCGSAPIFSYNSSKGSPDQKARSNTDASFRAARNMMCF